MFGFLTFAGRAEAVNIELSGLLSVKQQKLLCVKHQVFQLLTIQMRVVSPG